MAIEPDLLAATDPSWFCLRAAPKREHIAAATLRRELELPCFSPRIRFRKLTARGPVWFVEAMFPGYIFSKFVYRDLHRRVSSAAAVQCILRFGEFVPTLDEATVASLREAAAEDEVITVDPEIRPGDRMQVSDGPLRGLLVLVTQVSPGKERVRVLLEFLGRQMESEIARSKLLAARQHRQ
ncbi:transcription termination/antitermination protein NusG [soil metagenome]